MNRRKLCLLLGLWHVEVLSILSIDVVTGNESNLG